MIIAISIQVAEQLIVGFKAFAEAESALKSANEELIKVFGELALFIANKGKEVSAAFELTDAEKVMNCVSWREASENGTASASDFGTWCADHGIYDTSCSESIAPTYFTNRTVYGFDVGDLNGAGSDILASLSAWADQVKKNTDTILADNTSSVFDSVTNMNQYLSGISGAAASLLNEEATVDTLAETWGYDLFRYAHNNVCARVLDSCFNGIYEGCGTPPSGGRCANGATSSCPFNYNSKITISSSGDVTLNERSTIGSAASASCFGYSSSSDPYENLRGPVADARRSVMQKYLLDANADCDLYGEQLKTAAQKIAYQKVAAQQALQQKRLEFYNEERSDVLAKATAAGTNFNECISELWDCYETQASANPNWPDARIKTYCAQIANVPHCYQDMICNPSYAQFRAIIDVADSTQCKWHASDYTENTCRNIVTLNEILNGATDPDATITVTFPLSNSGRASTPTQTTGNNESTSISSTATTSRGDALIIPQNYVSIVCAKLLGAKRTRAVVFVGGPHIRQMQIVINKYFYYFSNGAVAPFSLCSIRNLIRDDGTATFVSAA